MTQFFLECTIRAALIVAVTALLLRLMRVKVAPVRHRVWTGVLLLMLALPLWVACGPKAPIRLLPASVSAIVDESPLQAPLPAYGAKGIGGTWQQIAAPSRPAISAASEILLGLYLFGAFIFLARLAIGTWKARCLTLESSPCPALSSRNRGVFRRAEGSAVDFVRSSGRISVRSSSRCAAPVTVGSLRPTIILPENWRAWPDSHLAAALAHEREHVRRRDPLVQWLALFNRAIFWFHPAAWWLERELAGLAEECCDAAVLAQGHDPQDYAETLMHMARAVMRSGARIDATGTAMPGTRLPQRIRGIFAAAPAAPVSRARVVLLIAACTAVCAAFFAVTMTRAQSTLTDWEKAAGGKQAFDAASVKENKTPMPPSGPPPRINMSLSSDDTFKPTGGLFRATKIPLTTFIDFAYKLDESQNLVLVSQAVHSTDLRWAVADRWDVEARAPGNPSKNQYRMMMQSLLADRFKLRVHWGTIQGPLYDVELQKRGKLGPQLTPHPAGAPCSAAFSPAGITKDELNGLCGGVTVIQPKPGRWRLSGRAVSLKQIADSLSEFTPERRPTVDRTGLAGTYDFSMEFAPDYGGPTPPGPQAPDPNVASFLDALRDQLGLKIDPVTGPIGALIVDHVEESTPN